MKSLFKPATVLMSRLKYPQKFMLVGLLLLLPLILVMTQYLGKVDEDLDFSSKERLGLQYNDPVLTFLQRVQEHTALSNAILRGETALRDSLTEAETQIEDAIAAVDQVNQDLGVELDVSDIWARIKSEWDDLKENGLSLTTADNETAHQTLSQDVVMLIIEVG